MQTPTTLIAPLDGLEFLQEYRNQWLQRPSAILPPHMSVCPEFVSSRSLGQGELDRLSAATEMVEPFGVYFDRTKQYLEANILYLMPEAVDELARMSEALHGAFLPELGLHSHRPFHLTLGMFGSSAELAAAEAQFWEILGSGKRLCGQVTKLELYERAGERWKRRFAFDLLGQRPAAKAPDLAA